MYTNELFRSCSSFCRVRRAKSSSQTSPAATPSAVRLVRIAVLMVIMAAVLAILGCSRDPNVKKQKYFDSGNRYFEKGKYAEAAIQYSNAIQVDPKFADAHYKLAQSYLHVQAWQKAYRELQRTIDLDPENVKAQLDLGGLLLGAHSYEEARGTINKILQNDPSNADAHMLLANLHLAQGDRQAAVEEAEKAITLDPKRPQFYVQLASFQSVGHVDAAEVSLKKALEIDPKFVPAIEALAIIYQGTSRGAEAEKLIKQVIELEPKSLQPRQALARLFYLQNRKADAEQVMIKAEKDLSDQAGLYRVLGDYYASTGDVNKAAAEFASLTKEHPKDFQVKEAFVELLLAQNKLHEATELDDEILKENPKDTGALLIRGRIQNVNGRYEDAINTLQTALKYAPENAGGHLQLGFALSRTGDLGRAEQEWREAAKLAPQLNDAQLELAQLALNKGDLSLLGQTAEQLIKNLPSDPRGYVLRAESEIASREMAAAEADIKKSIAVAPQNALGYSAMGGLLASRGKFQEAQSYFEQALDRDPNHFAALKGLVAIFLRQGQNGKAIERVRQQIAKSPNNDSFYTLLGSLQADGRDWAAAEASLQKAVSLNQNDLAAFSLLSKVQVRQGSADKALTTAYKSIQDNPKSVVGYFLAGTLEEARNWEKAEKLYQQALQIEPNYPLAANNLAYGMLQHGENTDVALSLAQIARQRMPESPDAADTLAWAYYQKGIYGLAADLLQEALKKSPENAAVHYHLGMVYQKQNNTIDARKQLERALQIDPKAPNADEIRKALNQMS
jgi:cellulose synthase operon protein C